MLESFGKFLFGFLFGAIVGCTAASLLTPKDGESIRKDIKGSFDEIRLDFELGKQRKRDDLEAELRRRWGEE